MGREGRGREERRVEEICLSNVKLLPTRLLYCSNSATEANDTAPRTPHPNNIPFRTGNVTDFASRACKANCLHV